ncbi:hypothetical protein Vretifemale_6035 [Volvox reticuliferus]|uniref:Uncharacterized protein n=1 Tax=Volvox reticuliferus TaxID=1737510 RepID=A0A8J4FM78_9CHLO|nr:hypothetical protein Vretifemale_6035 [Volvox reticuliferus]
MAMRARPRRPLPLTRICITHEPTRCCCMGCSAGLQSAVHCAASVCTAHHRTNHAMAVSGIDAQYVTYEHIEVYLHPLQVRLTYALGYVLTAGPWHYWGSK